MAKKNRALAIIRNATSNYVRQVIQIVVFILLTPFIVAKVGTEDFGLWSLIQATIGLLALMDMGFSASVVKYVADARGRGDVKRIGDLTATFFWQYTGLGLLTLLVTLSIIPVLPTIFGIPEDRAWTAQIVFLLIGLRAAQALPLGLFAGILVGYQQQLLSNITRTIGTVSYGLFAWWALVLSPSIETLAWVSLGTGLFANLLAVAFCLRAAEGMSLAPSRFRWGLLGEITTFSMWFFLIQVSLLIATRVDTIIINAVLPLTAVAVYTVAMRIAEKAATLCRQLTNALTPVVAELKGARETDNIRAVFMKGSMLAVASAVPLMIGLAWLAEDIVVTWMGEEFRDAALPCQLLLASAMVGIIHSNTENVLAMTGHQRFLALSSIGGQVLNVILTIILVQSHGLVGVAVATLVSQSLGQIFLVQRKAGSLYRLSMPVFYGRALWPSIPGAIACVTAIWLCSMVLAPDSLVSIAILIILGGLFFLPAFWWVGLGRNDRDYLGGRMRLLLKRGKSRQKEPEATS